MSPGIGISSTELFLCNGHNNDANITQEIIENNLNELNNWFERGDVFVVDRGFRDCLKYLKGLFYHNNFNIIRVNFLIQIKVLNLKYLHFSEMVNNKPHTTRILLG